jgi:hypothetical protein
MICVPSPRQRIETIAGQVQRRTYVFDLQSEADLAW